MTTSENPLQAALSPNGEACLAVLPPNYGLDVGDWVADSDGKTMGLITSLDDAMAWVKVGSGPEHMHIGLARLTKILAAPTEGKQP
jgi:hypothetical protein